MTDISCDGLMPCWPLKLVLIIWVVVAITCALLAIFKK